MENNITKDKTNYLFLHKLIKAIGDSMVKLFVPLIIYRASGNMGLVILYLCVHYFASGVLNILLRRFLQRQGVIAIFLSMVPIIAIQFVLTYCPVIWYICLIVGLLNAFNQVLYSVPINLLFAFTDKNTNVAKFEISTNVGKLIFILVSGFLLGNTLDNLVILAIASTVVYCLSIIPILFGYKLIKSSYGEITHKPFSIDKKLYRKYNLYHFCFGVYQSTLDIILPLYLYINNLSFESVAVVMALVEVGKILANILAKYIYSKGKPFVSVIIYCCLYVTAVVLILTIKSPVALYIISCVMGVSFPLVFVPLFKAFCSQIGIDNYQFRGMIYRDFYILTFRPVLYLPYLLYGNFLVQFCIGVACCGIMAYEAKGILDKKTT